MAKIGRPGLSREKKAELWERWKSGQCASDIARALERTKGAIHHVLAFTGVLVSPRVEEAVIADNNIRRRALPTALDGPQPPEKMFWAIDILTHGCQIDGNRIDLAAQVYGGVRADGRHNEVTGNRLVSLYPSAPGRGPIGIMAGTIELAVVGKGDFTNIAHNHFVGSQIAVFASRSRGLHVTGNTIVGVERQGFGVWIDYCLEAMVSANQVHDVMLPLTITNGQRNHVIDNVVAGSAVGAFVVNEEALDFSRNLIENTPGFGIGINGVGVSNRFAHNRVAHCGYAATDVAVGIGVVELAADVDITIESCEIFNTGVSTDHLQSTTGRAIGTGAAIVATCELANNRVVYEGRNALDPSLEHRAVWLVGGLATPSPFAAGGPMLARGGAIISGNAFEGPGFSHLVELQQIVLSPSSDLRFEKVIFANNRCQHITDASDKKATVMLFGGHLIVASNQVKAPRGVPSINLSGRPGTTLGNCTTGTIVNAGATTPTAPSWTNFNIQNII